MTARILLVNFDEASEGRLKEIFRQKGYRISPYTCKEPLAEHLSKLRDDVDLIILDASGNDPLVHDQLGEVRRYRAQHGHRPTVLCVSRVYRGPQVELELERKGARVVYVR
jgi:DNA-binding response OmpR family regulator